MIIFIVIYCLFCLGYAIGYNLSLHHNGYVIIVCLILSPIITPILIGAKIEEKQFNEQ